MLFYLAVAACGVALAYGLYQGITRWLHWKSQADILKERDKDHADG